MVVGIVVGTVTVQVVVVGTSFVVGSRTVFVVVVVHVVVVGMTFVM